MEYKLSPSILSADFCNLEEGICGLPREMKMQRSSPALSSSFMPERHIFRAN